MRLPNTFPATSSQIARRLPDHLSFINPSFAHSSRLQPPCTEFERKSLPLSPHPPKSDPRLIKNGRTIRCLCFDLHRTCKNSFESDFFYWCYINRGSLSIREPLPSIVFSSMQTRSCSFPHPSPPPPPPPSSPSSNTSIYKQKSRTDSKGGGKAKTLYELGSEQQRDAYKW